MNAGRDVERLIASWLVEEAPGRAPDRVLDAAGRVIDRTNQRRIVAEWREPMYVTMRGLLAAAVIGAVLIGGAIFFLKGAPNADVGASPTPGASEAAPSATPDALADLRAYRSARNQICLAAWPARNATDERVGEGLYDPSISAAERATKVDAIEDQINDITAFVNQLDALPVPAALATDEAATIARYRDTIELIKQVVDYLRAGDLVAAEAADNATAPLTVGIEGFERQYQLQPCP